MWLTVASAIEPSCRTPDAGRGRRSVRTPGAFVGSTLGRGWPRAASGDARLPLRDPRIDRAQLVVDEPLPGDEGAFRHLPVIEICTYLHEQIERVGAHA